MNEAPIPLIEDNPDDAEAVEMRRWLRVDPVAG